MAAAALVLSATYYEVGDFVEVVTFLVDSQDEAISPSEYTNIQVELRKKENTLAEVNGLTKFYADENLAFTVLFNKPAANRNVTVKVTATEKGNPVDWVRETTVLIYDYAAVEGDFGENKQNVVE